MKLRSKNKMLKQLYLYLPLLLCLIFAKVTSCSNADVIDPIEQTELADQIDPIAPSNGAYVLPYFSTPVHYPGIAMYTADMGKNKSTEINSEWVIRNSQYTTTSSEIIRNGFNAMHKISFDGFNTGSDYLKFVLAVQGELVNRRPVPAVFLQNLTGISFRAVSYGVPINIILEVFGIDGTLIKSENFEVTTDKMKSYTMVINDQNLHHISFKILGENQDLSSFKEGALGIDDIYLNNNSTQPFLPPTGDTELLDWLKKSSIHFFLWNYREVGGGRGVVLEHYGDSDKVSLSGIGYAYAAFILAEKEGMVSASEAKQKIVSLLQWQQDQNWFDGSGGWHGFPFHYFNKDGSAFWPDVSTIDWAMCAAGIRVVRQKYSNDPEIKEITTELLDRPKWEEAIDDCSSCSGRIAMGFNGGTGSMNAYRWGLAFSEETELVYLEALASGKVSTAILNKIIRDQKSGFYPSWFGAGFTYNWLQLWMGTKNPYYANSVAAYQSDATTSNAQFGNLFMGLTACNTLSGIDSSGFIKWDQYISNQGASVSGANTNEVIQISPAPYGAVLALPFIPTTALESLRTYISLGYYHPLLGLPDNIRINDLPQNIEVPVPNWDPFDINIGPIAMAIEQSQQNSIGNYYMSDPAISQSLQTLIQSF
jgi:hypothetical protein